jgi:hypothetical protein
MQVQKETQRFAIGTTFQTGGKFPRNCTVVDFLRTYNTKGECVKTRYVATHVVIGQIVTDYDVCETTIARGLVKEA